MDTSTTASEFYNTAPTFCINQDEVLNKDGHQNWYHLVLHDFNDGEQFVGVIHKYESWSEPSDEPELEFRGIRGKGDIEKIVNVRRGRKRIRLVRKSLGDAMPYVLTL